MDLRSRLTAELKTAMLARDAARVGALRMIAAKLKDADIAARPGGPIDEAASRPELAEKEEAEIAVIEGFLPQQMDAAAMQAAVREAVAEAGATSAKDMGKVMAVLRAKHAASLDMAKAGPMVKAALG